MPRSSLKPFDAIAVEHPLDSRGGVVGSRGVDSVDRGPPQDGVERRPQAKRLSGGRIDIKLYLGGKQGEHKQITDTHGDTFCVFGLTRTDKVLW